MLRKRYWLRYGYLLLFPIEITKKKKTKSGIKLLRRTMIMNSHEKTSAFINIDVFKVDTCRSTILRQCVERTSLYRKLYSSKCIFCADRWCIYIESREYCQCYDCGYEVLFIVVFIFRAFKIFIPTKWSFKQLRQLLQCSSLGKKPLECVSGCSQLECRWLKNHIRCVSRMYMSRTLNQTKAFLEKLFTGCPNFIRLLPVQLQRPLKLWRGRFYPY